MNKMLQNPRLLTVFLTFLCCLAPRSSHADSTADAAAAAKAGIGRSYYGSRKWAFGFFGETIQPSLDGITVKNPGFGGGINFGKKNWVFLLQGRMWKGNFDGPVVKEPVRPISVKAAIFGIDYKLFELLGTSFLTLTSLQVLEIRYEDETANATRYLIKKQGIGAAAGLRLKFPEIIGIAPTLSAEYLQIPIVSGLYGTASAVITF